MPEPDSPDDALDRWSEDHIACEYVRTELETWAADCSCAVHPAREGMREGYEPVYLVITISGSAEIPAQIISGLKDRYGYTVMQLSFDEDGGGRIVCKRIDIEGI